MDPSDRSLSRLLASDPTNPRSENTSIHPMQNFPPNFFNPSQFAPPPFNHSQYPQNSPPTQGMQNFNPFGSASNTQQYTQYFPSFQGFQQQHHFGVLGAIFGSAGGASSHGSDSTSPQSQRREVQQVEEDSSGSSPNEVRRAMRVNYSEEENLRLTSAWLKHSVDSIRGNDQIGESYWKSVAEEFNSNKPQGARTRSKVQLKSHWGKISAAVAKFNGVYGRMDFCSGESDDMLMDKARAVFKRENKEKPFTLEYVWKILKDQPKWRRIGPQEEKNKRTKVDEYGAYTSSSNPDTDEGDRQKEKRPEGQKRAKSKIRGKGKEKTLPQSPLGMQPDEDMVLFHDAISKRADALIIMNCWAVLNVIPLRQSPSGFDLLATQSTAVGMTHSRAILSRRHRACSLKMRLRAVDLAPSRDSNRGAQGCRGLRREGNGSLADGSEVQAEAD